MFKHINYKDMISHAANCIEVMLSSYRFFHDNKLWKGFFRHKWIALATITISALFAYWMLCDVAAMISGYGAADNYQASSLMDSISDEDKQKNAKAAMTGGSKYILMILLEIVIFHFSIRTIEILSRTDQPVSIHQFWKAELRMIHVMVRGFVQALLLQIVVSILFGIFGLPDLLKSLVMFIVYAYFIGHAFFDNYNELHKIDIKKSEKITQGHFGATLSLGMVASALLWIPFIGAIVAPIFGAISANIYGYQFALQDMEIIDPPAPSKAS